VMRIMDLMVNSPMKSGLWLNALVLVRTEMLWR